MAELYQASPEQVAASMLKGDLLGQKTYGTIMANIPDSVVAAALNALTSRWTEQQKNAYLSVMVSGSPGITLPHPEEPMDPSATLANTDVNAVINKWLMDWGVPGQYWEHWKTAIDIEVYDIYSTSIMAMGISQDTPAVTWDADGKRHLAIKAQWLNPGVIAHEQAHNSYALLTLVERASFSVMYAPLKNTDPLIRLLYSKNTYGLTNDIEGHAEVYRYIGQKMPTQLKPYYPRLF